MGGAADLSAVSEQLQARSEELNQSLAQADAASHTAHQVNRGASGLVKEFGKVIPLLTTAADLKQAEVGRTIDEATDRQKYEARHFAFQAAQALLKNEAFERDIVNCTSMDDIEKLASWRDEQSKLIGQDLPKPVRRAVENEYRDAVASMLTINAKGTRANQEAIAKVEEGIQSGRAEVATLTDDVRSGFEAIHGEAKEASLAMAGMIGLQADQLAEIENGNLDALLRDKQLAVFVQEHYGLVAAHVADQQAQQERRARLEQRQQQHVQLHVQCDRLTELGRLTGSKELVVAGKVSSVALDLRQAISSLGEAGTAAAAVNPALAAAGAIMTIANLFSQPEPDPLQMICDKILAEVREMKDMLAQGIEGLAENHRAILRSMCSHFRLTFENLQQGGVNTTNAITARMEALHRHHEFWQVHNAAMLQHLVFKDLNIAQGRYKDRDAAIRTFASFKDDVRKDIETLGFWASIHCRDGAINGDAVAATALAAEDPSKLASFVMTANEGIPNAAEELPGLFIAYVRSIIGEDLLPPGEHLRIPNGVAWATASELLLSIATYLPEADTAAAMLILNGALDQALEGGAILVSGLRSLVNPALFSRMYDAYITLLDDVDHRWGAAWNEGDVVLPTEEVLRGVATDSYDDVEWDVAEWSLPPSFRAIERLDHLPNGGVHMRTGPNKRVVGSKGWSARHLKNGGALGTGHARYHVTRTQQYTVYLDFTGPSGESLELASFTYTRGFKDQWYKNEPKRSIDRIKDAPASDLLRGSIGPFGKENTRFSVQMLGDATVNYNQDNINEAQRRLHAALVDHVSKPDRRNALERLSSGQLFQLEPLKAHHAVLKTLAALHGGERTIQLASQLPDPTSFLNPFEELKKQSGHAEFDPSMVPRQLTGPRPPLLDADYADEPSAHRESSVEQVEGVLSRLRFARDGRG